MGRARNRLLLRRFEQECRHARAVNEAALVEILTANAETEFGRRHGFAALAKTPDRWSSAVPLHHHADFAADIARMAAGERDVLVAGDVPFFAVTSGSTGAGKLVPTPPAHQQTFVRFYSGVIPAVPALRLPGGEAPHRGMALLSAGGELPRTPGGAAIGSASAGGLRRVRRLVPLLWTSPWPVFELVDVASQWYLHALFALREPTTRFVWAVFAPQLVEWLRMVEERWPELLRDIADGGISAALDISAATRAELAAALPADPGRARALEAAVAPGFRGFAPRAWPWLSYAMTVITGSFAAYVPALRHHLGSLPIYTSCYSASEAMIGLNLEIERPERYVLTPGTACFELIPLAEHGAAQPATIPLAAAEVGQCYEVVLTNRGGLYRYRLRDVVRIEGWHHEAPILSFQWRLGTMLDLVGEKSSEDHVLSAVTRAVGPAGASMIDYTIFGDTRATPPRYVVYIELADDAGVPAELEAELDAALRAENRLYAEFRRGERLGPVALVRLRQGTFEALARRRLEAITGMSLAQLKPLRLVQDEGTRQWLEEQRRA